MLVPKCSSFKTCCFKTFSSTTCCFKMVYSPFQTIFKYFRQEDLNSNARVRARRSIHWAISADNNNWSRSPFGLRPQPVTRFCVSSPSSHLRRLISLTGFSCCHFLLSSVGCPRKWHFGTPRNTEFYAEVISGKTSQNFRRNHLRNSVKFLEISCRQNSVDTIVISGRGLEGLRDPRPTEPAALGTPGSV